MRPTHHRMSRVSTFLGRRNYSTAPSSSVKDDLRALFRETAQPVTVVTTILHSESSSSEKQLPEDHISVSPRYHGATLSSFTSIALDPHPLVAFSLRVPSRLATSLRAALESRHSNPSDFVVNILSAAQESEATIFARSDVYLNPFESAKYTLTSDGLPVLANSLGALSCKLVSAPWPLHHVESLDRSKHIPPSEGDYWDGEGQASELFIAKVTRVERYPPVDWTTSDPQNLSYKPLLYHQRQYTTCGSKQ
jgi:flavin reductase (DIM6/NTAB) family NADH-FMN oxidoreductase RutF